jgi:hypothetical protein
VRLACGLMLAGLAMLPGVAQPGAARAQTLDAVARARAALYEAWEKTPLTAARVMFEAQKATGFGQYQERPNAVFKPGEPLITYLEPVGFVWKQTAPDLFHYALDFDFLLLTPDGKVLGGKEGFLHVDQQSHARNLELMVNITATLNGAPPGKYILKYTMHDANSGKETSFQQPFEIANPAG